MSRLRQKWNLAGDRDSGTKNDGRPESDDVSDSIDDDSDTKESQSQGDTDDDGPRNLNNVEADDEDKYSASPYDDSQKEKLTAKPYSSLSQLNGKKRSNSMRNPPDKTSEVEYGIPYPQSKPSSKGDNITNTQDPFQSVQKYYKQEIRERDNHVLSLQKELESFKRLHEQSQNDINTVSSACKKTIQLQKDEINELKEHLLRASSTQQQQATKWLSAEEIYKEEIQTLQSKIQDATHHILSLESDAKIVNEYQEKMNHVDSTIATLERALNLKSDAVFSLQSEVNELKERSATRQTIGTPASLHGAEQSKDELQLRNEELSRELEKNLRKNAVLLDEIRDSKKQHEEFKEKIISEGRKDREKANELVAHQQETIEQMKQLLQKTTQQQREGNEEQLRTVISSLESDVSNMRRDFDDLLREANARASADKDNFKREYDSKLREAEDTMSTQLSQLQEQRQQIQSLHDSLNHSNLLAERNRDEMKHQSQSINELKRHLALAQEENKQCKNEAQLIITALQKDKMNAERVDTIMEDYENQLQEQQSIIDSLKKNLTRKKRRIASLERDLSKTASKTLHNANDNVQTSQLKEQLSQKIKECQQMQKKLENKKNHVSPNHHSSLEKELASYKQSEINLKKTISKLQTELSDVTSRIENKSHNVIDDNDDKKGNSAKQGSTLIREHDIMYLSHKNAELFKSNAALKQAVLEMRRNAAARISQLEAKLELVTEDKLRREDDAEKKTRQYEATIAALKQDNEIVFQKKESVQKRLKDVESLMKKTNKATLNAIMAAAVPGKTGGDERMNPKE